MKRDDGMRRVGQSCEVFLYFLATSLWLTSVDRAVGQCQSISNPGMGVVDGSVSALCLQSDAVYLGGEFHYAGPRTRGAACFSWPTGERAREFPVIDGTVFAIEPDGTGGWFIGGQFQRVDGFSATNLIHVSGDQRWDRTWNAAIVGTSVYSLAVQEGRLFAGGQFQRVKGEVRRGLASVRLQDAELEDWAPTVNGTVYAMVLTNGMLYVGGQFTTLGEASRGNGGVVDTVAGSVGTWNPAADRAILSLRILDGFAYAGGTFTSIGGKPRNRLAALSLDTGLAANWNPNPNGQVRALAVDNERVWVGGDFTSIGAKSRRGFAALDRTTGAALDFDLGIEGSGTPQNLVWAVRVEDGKVYVAGSFSRVQGKAQPMLAAAELATGNPVPVPLATRFNGARDDAWIAAVALAEGRLAVGGSMESMGGVPRPHAAAFSLITGALLDWDPAPDHSVLTLAGQGNALLLGGTFTNCGGAESRGVAKVDPVLGRGDPIWEFGITNRSGPYQVRTLVALDDRVVVGGLFDGVGGETRRWLAAVDPIHGAPLSWQANIKGGTAGLKAVACGGDVLVLAGDFTSVGNQARSRLAAVRSDTGEVLAWNPAPNREVSALALTADRLYAGGSFTRLAGVDLRFLAAFAMPTLELVPWDAAVSTTSDNLACLAAAETVVYATGSFDAIGGEFRTRLASLNAANTQAMDWDPAPDEVPSVVALSDRWVGVGGGFRAMGTSPERGRVAYFALFDRAPVMTASNAVSGKVKVDCTTGDRTRAVLEMSTNLTTWFPMNTNGAAGFRWTTEMPTTDGSRRFYRVMAE